MDKMKIVACVGIVISTAAVAALAVKELMKKEYTSAPLVLPQDSGYLSMEDGKQYKVTLEEIL